MLFSELYNIMVNKVTFVGFGGAIVPIAPPGSTPGRIARYGELTPHDFIRMFDLSLAVRETLRLDASYYCV